MRLSHVKNFIYGAGTAFDIMPTRRNYPIGEHILITSNRDALFDDWRKVGGEIAHSFREAKAELRAHEQ